MSTVQATNLKHGSSATNNVVLDASGNTTISGALAVSGVTGNVYPLVQGTAVASTSGVAVDFTGIPSWARRVTVMFDGVSTNGTSALLLQLGDAGGVETTGYTGMSGLMHVSGANTYTGVTSGIPLTFSSTAAANLCYGSFTISNVSGNNWVVQGGIMLSSQLYLMQFAGGKTLSSTLDRIRITTVGGTDTFDAGSINILYEG